MVSNVDRDCKKSEMFFPPLDNLYYDFLFFGYFGVGFYKPIICLFFILFAFYCTLYMTRCRWPIDGESVLIFH